MRSFLAFLISQSILFPFIIGLVRLRRMGKTYQPFFILLAVGVFTELCTGYIIKVIHGHNTVISNLYALTEWLLIAWQFHVWGFLRIRKNIFYGLIVLTCLIWITENLVMGQLFGFPPYFRIFYYFIVVLLSVNKINYMITHDNRNLLGHADFLICIAWIIFFIYKIICEWAYQTSIFGRSDITNHIILFLGYINVLTNIIFAIALLRIPRPQKFTLS